jgi:hypothetical protein
MSGTSSADGAEEPGARSPPIVDTICLGVAADEQAGCGIEDVLDAVDVEDDDAGVGEESTLERFRAMSTFKSPSLSDEALIYLRVSGVIECVRVLCVWVCWQRFAFPHSIDEKCPRQFASFK